MKTGLTTINDGTTHTWFNYYCPFCRWQLIKVVKSNVVFCSNHELYCDYGDVTTNTKEFLTEGDVLALTKKDLITRRDEIAKSLINIDKKIQDFEK